MEHLTDKRKETNWCVYMHTNRVNNKKYIGITSQKPTNRWKNGAGYDKQPRFFNAIQKYGWDSFQHEILYTNLTQDEASQIEQDLIAKYETLDAGKGYNLSPGGVVFIPTPETRAKQSAARMGWCPSEETRRKMSEAWKGRVITPEWRAHLSEAQKGRVSPNKGKTLPPEWRANMSKSHKGRVVSEAHRQRLADHLREVAVEQRKPVLCVETGVVYESLTAASEATGAQLAVISKVCLGKGHTAGGYHWRYADEVVTVDG